MDLSIIIPAFRPHRWVDVYNSALQSCTRYSFEIVFIGPYGPPDELKNNPQIRFIQDWGTSTRCTQIGSYNAAGKLLARTDDDAVFFPDALNQAIDLYNSVNNPKDVVALRYREGVNFTGALMHPDYWFARHHFAESYVKKGRTIKLDNGYVALNIPYDYLVCMTLLLSKEFFIDIGGYDCRFEHLAFAAHDLCYRIQRDGGILHISPIEVTNINWSPGAEEHKPIEISHVEHDFPLFIKIQKDPDIIRRIKIDFNNWKDSPDVWARRFPNGKT